MARNGRCAPSAQSKVFPMKIQSHSAHPGALPVRLRAGIGLLAIVAAIFAATCGLVMGDDKKQPVDPKPASTNAANAKPGEAPKTKLAAKKLTGAELYSIHCMRCHPERYPTERTAAQWRTILLHMRVRANLPAEQARTILKYLQDNSGR